jgi:hypothetical protein
MNKLFKAYFSSDMNAIVITKALAIILQKFNRFYKSFYFQEIDIHLKIISIKYLKNHQK